VLRSGQVRELSARELAPGDIIMLEAGNVVPADSRLLETVNLRIQESMLTGESEAVEKDPTPLEQSNLPLGDRRNMAYMGTTVTYGRGKAVVTASGMDTELGHIASMLQTVATELTPLQRRLDQVGRVLAGVALAIAGLVFLMGWLRGEDLQLMFLTTVSIAVAIIPEGLPAVLTITLALGAQRMLKRQALIRKLPAVETLGSITVICSDKTGTLTENRMTVTILDVAGHRLDLNEALDEAAPLFNGVNDSNEPAGQETLMNSPASLRLLLAGGALCNDAVLKIDESGRFHAVGDPTEGALVVAAARFGLWKEELDQQWPRLSELPFDSDRKRMTTIHQAADAGEVWETLPPDLRSSSFLAFTKGAVDGLLEIANEVLVDGQLQALDRTWRQRIEAANSQLAQNGMRVLGVTFRPIQEPVQPQTEAELERQVIFLGMVGIIDPPRPEVKQAVQTCKTAGIRPIMITGDHPLTAQHIAAELGIAENGTVLTGQELAKIPVEQLQDVVETVSVYARVSPEHKLKVVQALQERGHIVAMTGDGVNDAPALKKADIGVAMGITGTDVSKEAADMVLRDDNFATIVAAVEEGRVIYDNVRKFVKFSIAGNIGKVSVMLFAPLLNMALPLLPLQLLWLNLLTDGLLGLGLGVEPAEKNTMRRPPRLPDEPIFSRGTSWHMAWLGFLIGLISLGAGFWYWSTGQPNWQTMIFTTLAFAQMGQALAVRSGQESLFKVGLFSNRLLLGMVGLTLGLQLMVIYLPWLQTFFGTTALSPLDLVISLGLSSLVFVSIELEKWFTRRRRSSSENKVTRSVVLTSN
jgi:Ca2+-transporting ATPase